MQTNSQLARTVASAVIESLFTLSIDPATGTWVRSDKVDAAPIVHYGCEAAAKARFEALIATVAATIQDSIGGAANDI